METPGNKFILEEAKELLQLIAAREAELGRTLSDQEKNDLLIPFISEHGEELAGHAFAALSIEEAESIRSQSPGHPDRRTRQ